MIDLINKLNSLLSGRKTYIGATLLAIAVFAQTIGWLDQATFTKVQAILIAWIGTSIRAAIK